MAMPRRFPGKPACCWLAVASSPRGSSKAVVTSKLLGPLAFSTTICFVSENMKPQARLKLNAAYATRYYLAGWPVGGGLGLLCALLGVFGLGPARFLHPWTLLLLAIFSLGITAFGIRALRNAQKEINEHM